MAVLKTADRDELEQIPLQRERDRRRRMKLPRITWSACAAAASATCVPADDRTRLTH
jgi:hypothetical protein